MISGSPDPCLSLDLSQATDTFDRRLCKELVSGLIESIATVEPMAYKTCCFLEQVAVPDWLITFREWRAMGLDKDFELQSVRGIMMGTPISWLVLNLYNKFCREVALTAFRLDISWRECVATRPILPSNIPFTVFCGDDCATRGPEPELNIFVDILETSGAVPSPGVNSISTEFATFTELFFIAEGIDFKLIPVPKLKCFAPKMFASRLPREKEIPAEWTRGTASSSQISYCSTDEYFKTKVPILRRLPFIHNRRFVDLCRKLGLPVYLGREFGGLGYYHRPGRNDPPKLLRAVAILTKHDQSLGTYLDLRSLGSVWDINSRSELGTISKSFSRYAV
jgi:hypothetical protein